MKQVIQTLSYLIMKHQALVAVLLLAITAFFAVGLKDVQLKTIFSDLLPKDHPFVQTFKEHPNFGNPLTVSVFIKRTDGDIYTPDTLQKIWDLTRDIDLTPGVDHDQIMSIATEKARFAEATPLGIDSRPLMGDAPPSTKAEIDAFREAVSKAPTARRFLISEDETGALIIATFIERLLDYGEAYKYLQAMVEGARDEHHEVHIAGQPMLTGWVYHYEVQMLFIFGVTASALLLALILYMRNFAGVIAPVLASLMAAIWGFGLVGWLKLAIDPLLMVVPLLLVARTFSHCVQFIERYFEIFNHTGNKRKSAEIALSVMAAPSVLGIITDATGLFLIAIAPIPAMERFALFCGFWAMMLIPTSTLFLPILLTWLPMPRNAAALAGEDATGFYAFLRNALAKLSRITFGKAGRVTLVVLLAITAYGIWDIPNLKTGNPVEGSSLLWKDSEFNIAVSEINRNFPGVNTLEVIFEAKSDDESARVARQAETITVQNRLQKIIERMDMPPEATLSFGDYLPEANRLFSGGNPKWSPLDPTDEAMAAASNALMVGTSPKAFSNVVDFELRHSTVSFWYKDNTQPTVDRAISQLNTALDETGLEFENFRIRPATGVMALQQSLNDTVKRYQWLILAALNVVILLTCSFAYRSFLAGVLLLIPVNLSNLLLGVTMTWMGIGMDVNTLPITAIGIGVGIDYGIYLLSRICEEYLKEKSVEKAIVTSVSTTGKAIFFTASIVLIAILPWYFLSDLKFLADMGLLLVVVMLINMLIALIVVPLLVWLMNPAFIRSEDLIVSESYDPETLKREASEAKHFSAQLEPRTS